MSSLKILGWEIPAASITRRNPPIGERSDSLLGGKRNRHMAHRIELEVTTAPMTGDDAECLIGLLSGNSHVFPFNADLWSTIGLPPTTGWTASISATQSKFGGFSASVTDISWPVAFVESPGVWTVLVSRWNGTSWDDYIVRSDGAKWLNGTRNDATATAWLTFNTSAGTGAIALTGSPTYYDEVCFLPFMVSSTFATSVSTFRSTTAMTTTPQAFTVESSAFTFQSLVMRCVDPVRSQAAPFWDPVAGAWDNTGAVVSFTLVQAAASGTEAVPVPFFGFGKAQMDTVKSGAPVSIVGSVLPNVAGGYFVGTVYSPGLGGITVQPDGDILLLSYASYAAVDLIATLDRSTKTDFTLVCRLMITDKPWVSAGLGGVNNIGTPAILLDSGAADEPKLSGGSTFTGYVDTTRRTYVFRFSSTGTLVSILGGSTISWTTWDKTADPTGTVRMGNLSGVGNGARTACSMCLAFDGILSDDEVNSVVAAYCEPAL